MRKATITVEFVPYLDLDDEAKQIAVQIKQRLVSPELMTKKQVEEEFLLDKHFTQDGRICMESLCYNLSELAVYNYSL